MSSATTSVSLPFKDSRNPSRTKKRKRNARLKMQRVRSLLRKSKRRSQPRKTQMIVPQTKRR